MKLRISYFNRFVLRKDLSRFAPVWGLYTLGLFLIMSAFYNARPDRMASTLSETMSIFSVLNLAYAFLCATVLFGDLFQSRMCNALHAMPMRRAGWFLTHITAGIAFALIPYVLLAGTAAILLQEFAVVALWWFLGIMAQYLFYFGLAVLCAMCVGSRFAHAMVYGIGSFLSMIVYWLTAMFYEPLLYGITIDMDAFSRLCPTVYWISGNFFRWNYSSSGYAFTGLEPVKWIYLTVCAAIGLLCLILALLVYRRRKLESAGDFISLRSLSPVFLLLFTLVAGAVFYTFGEIFIDETSYLFLFIGLITGFFTCRMLLERSLKVFRWKSILACVAILLAFSGSLVLTNLDPLGLTRWIPAPNEVESASFSVSGSGSLSKPLTDEDGIETVTLLHKQLLSSHDKESRRNTVTITYHLKNGRTVRRTYHLDPVPNTVEAQIAPILSSWENVMGGLTLDYLLENTLHIYANNIEKFPEEGYEALYTAIAQDCLDGNMAQTYMLHENDKSSNWLEINYAYGSEHDMYMYLEIYDSCRNTVAVLEKYAAEDVNNLIN